MLVCSVHGGGIDLYQYSTYFVRSRFLYFLDLENVWRSETFADDRFHESLLKWLGSAVIAGSSIIFREYLFCRVEHLDQVDWVFFHHVLHLLLRCLRKECA